MFEQRIIDRINQLVQMGEKVLSTKTNSHGFGPSVDTELFHRWMISSLGFLSSVFGENSEYFKQFKEKCHDTTYYYSEYGVGILKGAKDDIEGGHLKKLEALVSADIFTDFLDMAEHLLQQGYKDPAAMLVGAVLEDGLRRIAVNKKVPLKNKEDISSLDTKLADAEVYTRLTQKKIRVWKEIRDNAAHGKFEEYESESVEDMVKGVTDFLETQL